jgi:hypothetical protein
LHCRSTPELDQLRAHLSALMPHRVAAGVLAYLLPVEAGKSPETLRRHTLKIGEEVLVRSRGRSRAVELVTGGSIRRFPEATPAMLG